MSDKQNEIPEDIYSKHLKAIRGIRFTRRQIDVIACIVSGWDVKSVAARLSISPSTVETHIDAVVQKLGSGGRNSILSFIEQSGKDQFVRQHYQQLMSGNPVSQKSLSIDLPNQFSILTSRAKVLKNFKLKFVAIGFVFLSFMGFGLLFLKTDLLVSGPQKVEKSFYVRSDLSLPHESQLLNRAEILNQIDQKLKGPEIQAVTLVGIGGAGKTTIARHYARQQKMSVVWEINAETHNSLTASFEELAYALALLSEDKKELRVIAEIQDIDKRETSTLVFVKSRLQRFSDWLLIYDNVEDFADIKKFFPYDPQGWGRGKIILTSRNKNIENNSYIGRNNSIYIDTLNEEDKLKLFKKLVYSKNDRGYFFHHAEQFESFLKEIPPFPLDISAAAHYLRETKIPPTVYLENMRDFKEDFAKAQGRFLKTVSNYNQTRYSILTLSLDLIVKENPDFIDLLVLIGLLDSQNIPKNLLVNFKGHISSDQFIHQLRKFSLIAENPNGNNDKNINFSLHRSTQEIIIHYIQKHLDISTIQEKLSSLIEKLNNYINAEINWHNVSEMRSLSSHWEAILSHHEILGPALTCDTSTHLGVH